jgi:hypothetical protein
MISPKEKADELVKKMYNTEHCGIEHFPNKRYCDCTEMNLYQAKQCALIAVDEILENFGTLTEGKKHYVAYCTIEFYQEVKQEIELIRGDK